MDDLEFLIRNLGELHRTADHDPATPRHDSLYQAIRERDTEDVRRFLEIGERPRKGDLATVGRRGPVEMIEDFLRLGLLRKDHGAGAFGDAAEGGNLDVVRFWLDQGLDTETVESGLERAVTDGRREVVEYLLSWCEAQGLDELCRRETWINRAEWSMRHLFTEESPLQHHRLQVLKRFLQGEPWDDLGPEPENPVEAARRLFMRAQAEAEAAYFRDHPEQAPELEPAEPEDGAVLSEEEAAVLRKGAAEKVLEILRQGATDVDPALEVERVPAAMAAVSAPDVLDALLSAGIDPGAQDAQGRTALMEATRRSNLRSVTLLIEAGVDVLQTDAQGQTAVFMAQGPIMRSRLREAALAQPVVAGNSLSTPPAECPVRGKQSGADYFVDAMFYGHPQWALSAVEATGAAVPAAYARLTGASRWVPGAADKRLLGSRNEVFLFSLKGSAWSLIVHEETDFDRIVHEARELSDRLQARAVAFGYEETGGSSVLELWKAGEQARSVRGKNRWKKFFRELELYLPFYAFEGEGGLTGLSIDGISRDDLERLDYFDLEPA